MISITDKTKCCGCNACVQCCPKHCISMKEDEQGFLYPIIDKSTCIDCGFCDKICPMQNISNTKKPQLILAIKNKNEKQRLNSSSGGLFILLAEHIIKQGGIIFGARFNSNWEVEHCHAMTNEELTPLMQSKYVQSNIRNTYKEAEQFLKLGKQVMFVGTSCQIAGLRNFLRKEYNNLLAVDFICHGVPSPGIWKKYLEEIKTKQNINLIQLPSLKSIPEITGISFREKQCNGYSWKKYGFVINSRSTSENKPNNVILLSSLFNHNTFIKGFLSNLYLRPSCYTCTAKDGASHSDLTIGDFWGIQNCYPNFDDDKGISVAFIHTNKGKNIIKEVSSQMNSIETNFAEATASNPSYLRAVPKPQKYSLFWKTYAKTKSVHIAVKIATKQTITERIKAKFRHYTRKLYKLINIS